MATSHVMRRSPSLDATAIVALVALIAVCHLAGAAGALVTDPSFYRELTRPAWAPPPWLFAPVWLTLYTVMGISAWLVWRTPASRDRTAALGLFAVQLALNALWTPVFFGLRSLVGGLVVVALLDVAIFATIVAFGRCSKVAAWALVPYAAWVGFATALNATLVLLN